MQVGLSWPSVSSTSSPAVTQKRVLMVGDDVMGGMIVLTAPTNITAVMGRSDNIIV